MERDSDAINPAPIPSRADYGCWAIEQQPVSGAAAVGQLSPDRQFAWDGTTWRPVVGWRWEPTDWTRPMQLAAGAYFIVQAVAGSAVLVVSRNQLHEVVLRQLQRQMASQPNPPDASQVGQIVDFSVNTAIGFGIFFAVVGLALGVMTVLWRWSWLFYADLVIFALGAVGVVSNIANAANGYPALLWIPSLAFSVLSAGLFAWLLVGRVKRGVWGARRAPVT